MTRFTSSITHVVTIKTTGDLTNLSAIFEGHEHYTNKIKQAIWQVFLIYSVNNHLLALLLTNTYCSSKYYFGETGGKLCRSRTGESNGAKGKGGGLDLSRAEWSAWGQMAKTHQKLDWKIREIDGSYLCLQRFDKFWICSGRITGNGSHVIFQKLVWTNSWNHLFSAGFCFLELLWSV